MEVKFTQTSLPLPPRISYVLLDRVQRPEVRGIIFTILVFAILGQIGVSLFHHFIDENRKYPLINGKKWWDFVGAAEKENFVNNSKHLLGEGFKKESKGFRIQTELGVELVLSPRYANIIKDNPNLSFSALNAEIHHSHLHGFEAFREGSSPDKIFETAIRESLMKALGSLNEPVSEETAFCLSGIFTESKEWHAVEVKSAMMHISCQLSAKIFTGDRLCRNPAWLKVTGDYTWDVIRAATVLRKFPAAIRPIANWFLPTSRILQADLRESRRLLNPLLEERRKEAEERKAKGLEPKKYVDAVAWMEEAAQGRPYDAAAAQIMMSMAANFSSADALTQILFDLCGKPQLIEDLRKEIIAVMQESKWDKSSMYKLVLMDSVLKESQRLKPSAIAVMRRIVLKDVALPDGILLRKGSRIMVSVDEHWKEENFENAHEFDGYRFMKLRKQGETENVQFVSTAPSTLGFGHGHNACPGRFFVANEFKIFLCHFLMKYDFKLAPEADVAPNMYALFYQANQTAKILLRRRREEIQL